MIHIDGSQGEGGGQVLRSSLALSLVTGRPFAIHNIRARRSKPGLMQQHLTSVQAAATVGGAEVRGATLGSGELSFTPGKIAAGDYHFSVGTAGSATLVLQTVLPALLCAEGPSTLRLEGGTHNPWAPPFNFLRRAFLPLVNRMGPTIEAKLVRPGFYPAGGGEIRVTIQPKALSAIELLTPMKPTRISATAMVARLPRSIAERELDVVKKKLDLNDANLHIEEVENSRGPGNAVTIEVESKELTEVFTGFGEKRVSAETVASKCAAEARRYLESGFPVDEYLADQLMLPMALAGGGAYCTGELSLHSRTNMDVIEMFLDVRFEVDETRDGTVVRVATL